VVFNKGKGIIEILMIRGGGLAFPVLVASFAVSYEEPHYCEICNENK